MTNPITLQDMREELNVYLYPYTEDWNTENIIDELKKHYGLCKLDSIPHDEFIAILAKHQIA